MGQQRVTRGPQAAIMILALMVVGSPVLAQAKSDVVAAAQEAKLKAIHDGAADTHTLEARLRDRDPAIAGAALAALSARNPHEAMEALVRVIDDTTEPVRLQAFQLLLDAPDSDPAVVGRALARALKDPDSALVVRAVQELVGRGDPQSVATLMDAQRDGDVELRLLIVKSVGMGDPVHPCLFNALGDPDKRVREAAEAALFPSRIDP
jgi:HEAT repeat protein